MSRRSVAGGGASFAALVWAAACTLVYRRAFGRNHGNAGPMPVPSDFGAAHETFEVQTADGLRLAGWYLPGKLPAAVIVSGGYRSRAGDVLGISVALQRAGFHVVVYGWRGTDGSDRASHTLGVFERNDLMAVIDAVVARLGNVPIGLLGYSMGGSVSISVAAGDGRIRAVCADSAFADPRQVIGDRVKRAIRLPAVIFVSPVVAFFASRTGARLSDFRPADVVAGLAPRPLLLIHGEADSAVSLAHANKLFETAREPKELWVLPGVEHVGAYYADREAYVGRVRSFFETALLTAHPQAA